MSSKWPILCGVWRTNVNWMISGLRRRSAWHAACWSAHHTALSWGKVHGSLLPVMASVLTVSSQHHVQRYVEPCCTWWHIKTRSAGTVHTSAKAHVTSVAIWIWICIQTRDPDRHQNVTISLLVHCQPSLKISCISVPKFSRKVANRQTDNDENITLLAEVTRQTIVSLKCARYFTK